MGLTSLDALDDIIDANLRNYRQYRDELADLPGIRLMQYDESERCNYQYVILEVDAERTAITRDQLVDILHAENVRARRYFFPGVHRMEPYRSLFPHAGLLLPHTEALSRRVLSLPTGTAVGPAEVHGVCDIIRCAVLNGRELAAWLVGAAAPAGAPATAPAT
jgi:dTDP-4-amino-4,6-dideoxygalactose transaminase